MADPDRSGLEPVALGCFEVELAGLPRAAPGAPVALAECRGLCLATIAARSGETGALQQKIWTLFGSDLPRASGVSTTEAVSFVGIAPDIWLGVRDDPPAGSTARLIADLAGVASVVDLAGAYAVLRIDGASARNLLSRGAAIDLHRSRFGMGSAAVTAIAHVAVILWQSRGPDSFDVAIPRSYSASFWYWLSHAAAGAGLPLAAR